MAKTPDDDTRQAVALFRYGLVADLVNLPPGTPGIGARLRAKAERDYDIPGTDRTRVAAETLRDWMRLYRRGGFDALHPRPRTDRGRPRRLSAEVAEQLIAVKTANPAFSVRAVIDDARRRGVPDDIHLAPSTVHRLLAREGLFERDADQPVADRRRFAYRYAGELWMSDVMHGPAVPDGRRRRKTYLAAFIDDATRVVPYAAFAFSENTAAFLPVFKQALMRRGQPARLYVDYVARHIIDAMCPAVLCGGSGKGPFPPRDRGGRTAHNPRTMISPRFIDWRGCHAGAVLHQAADRRPDTVVVARGRDRRLCRLARGERVRRPQCPSSGADAHALCAVRSRPRHVHARRRCGACRSIRRALGGHASAARSHEERQAPHRGCGSGAGGTDAGAGRSGISPAGPPVGRATAVCRDRSRLLRPSAP